MVQIIVLGLVAINHEITRGGREVVHVHCPVEHNNVRDDAQCIMIKDIDIIQMCEGCNRVVLEICKGKQV